MAQLKVKQISDFVTAVGGIHDGTVGAATVTAIAGVQSDVDVNATAIALNTAKVGITTDQSSAIVANTAKVGITTDQADAIVANTAKVGITTDQSSAIVANTAKVGITDAQSSAIVANTAKVGITDAQSSAIVANKDAIATEKGRIDALLLNSSETLDTFAEIKSFVDELDTADVAGLSTALSTAVSNDAVHASGISANSTAIANLDLDFSGDFDAKGSAAAAQSAAVLESTRLGDLAYDRLGDAGAAEDAANDYTDEVIVNLNFGDIITNNAVDFDAAGSAAAAQSAAASDATAKANAAQSAAEATAAADATSKANAAQSAAEATTAAADATSKANTAKTDAIASAKTYTDTEISDLDTELRAVISGVAGTDKVEQIALFGSVTEFSVTRGLSLENNDILVFVNGLQIHQSGEGIDGFITADGLAFRVSGLGYDLEANDHIVVVGVAA